MSKLVEVLFLEVATRGESAVLALRWEATGPGGRLFPALDADMSLTPAGQHSTRLSLTGAYRPAPGYAPPARHQAAYTDLYAQSSFAPRPPGQAGEIPFSVGQS
jgi:hypothetical protein